MTSILDEQLKSILPGWETQPSVRRSWLLNFLPSVYAGDDFMNRFLCIFEDTLTPLLQFTGNMHYYFHPMTTPTDLVPWIANWLALVLDESWSLEQRRQLIYSAVDLYSRRGTRRGLVEYIKLYAGVEPEISEYSDGMVLGPETFLGLNTTIAGRERHTFTVTIHLPDMSEEELASKEVTIRRIIEAEKPAHTTYRLRILNGENGGKNGHPKQVVLDEVEPVDYNPFGNGNTGGEIEYKDELALSASDEVAIKQALERPEDTDQPAAATDSEPGEQS